MTLEGLFMFQRFVPRSVESVLGGHIVIGSTSMAVVVYQCW